MLQNPKNNNQRIQTMFLEQSFFDSQADWLRSLKNPDAPHFDVVVITASNEHQAEIFRTRLEMSDLPERTDFVIIPDKNGERIGSGGATLEAVRYIGEKYGSFRNLRVAVIHSGGDGKRIPNYSAMGKLFSPVPRLLPCGRPSTLFDEIMISIAGVPSRIKEGMLILSGDILLLFNPLQIDFCGHGAAALAFKESVKTGVNHGVYLQGKEDNVAYFLHKQSEEYLRSTGAVNEQGNVSIDTGAVIFAPDILESMYELVDTPEKAEKYINTETRLSFYADFLYPLAEESTLEEYYLEKPEGEFNGSLRQARTVLWQTLRQYRLQQINLSPSKFIHFGTTAQVNMLYREDKKGNRISALGFGCMRLPQDDREKCGRLIDSALKSGINYFDTAFMYSGNEELVGSLLGRYDRGSYFLASKIPPALCFTKKDFERIFRIQLKRLGTDYIDYYLIHCLSDYSAWNRLCRMGIEDWIREKIESGAIRNIGFSYHGGTADFKKLIDSFDWDFAQVQYNYMDEFNQAGREGVEYAHSKGIPLIVMEPLRGGSLTGKLPQKALERLAADNQSAASLGLRWVLDKKEILCVLSGMNTEEQLSENTVIAESAAVGCLGEDEKERIEFITSAIRESFVIGCTGCGYCQPCPNGVAIPACFEARNNFENGKNHPVFKMNPARRQYLHSTAVLGKSPMNASLCVKCGRCEKKCPQGLKIMSLLEETAEVMEPAWFMIPIKAYRMINSGKKR